MRTGESFAGQAVETARRTLTARFKAEAIDSAELDARILVGGQAPARIRAAFRAFVRERLPVDCRAEFIDQTGAPALALDWNMPQLAAARRALTEEWGKDALLIGSGAVRKAASLISVPTP